VSPADWERKASHADAQAEQLAAEGRIADAVVLSVQAQRYREVAEEMRRALTPGKRPRTVHSDSRMTDAHKAALGTSRPGHAAKFRRWIANAKQERPYRAFSLRGLAEAAGTSASALSQAQRPRSDALARPIRPSTAREVERLTGWPADAAHWPAGIQDE
jgi:hypothetical protein